MEATSIFNKKLIIKTEPYPHIIIENCLPLEYYKQLEAAWPNDDMFIGGKPKVTPNTLYLVRITHDCKLNQIWKDFMRLHTDEKFLNQILNLFGKEIRHQYHRMNNRRLTVHCNLGINTPVVEKGSVRIAHVDNTTTLFNSLLYMPIEGDEAGGNLEIFKYKEDTDPRIWLKAEFEDSCIEKVGEVKYAPNTLIFFMNSIKSIHGVSKRAVTNNNRRYVNVTVQSLSQLFNYEKYRVQPKE